MNDPYAWTALAIIAILGIILTFYFALRGRKIRKISFDKSSYTIVGNINEELKDLEIKYDNKIIDSLSITKIAIWNDGNQKLEETDFASSKPLAIEAPYDCKILNSSIIISSEEANSFSIDMDNEKNMIFINFEYIDPKEGIIVQVLHTGNYENLKLVGKIKGGISIKNENLEDKLENNIFYKALNNVLDKISENSFINNVLLFLPILATSFISIDMFINNIELSKFKQDLSLSTENSSLLIYFLLLLIFVMNVFLVIFFRVSVANSKVPKKLRLHDK